MSDVVHASEISSSEGEQADLRAARGARAKRTAFLGIAFQATSALSQLIALGLLIRAEGAERFGLWMTVLALTTLAVPLSTLGQQSALVTRLSGVALADPRQAVRVFSASCLVLGLATSALLVLLLFGGFLVPWSHLLNADGPLTRDVAAHTAVMGLSVALVTFPAIHASFAVFAHQRGDLVHLVCIASTLVALGGVALAVQAGAPLWAIGALTLAGAPLAGLWLWGHGIASGLVPRPRRDAIDRATFRAQFSAGLHFFVIDVTTLILLRTPELIVAHLHGVQAVAAFAAIGRMSTLMQALFQALLLPLWPALGEANGRGDREWIRTTARSSLALVFALWAAAALGIVLLGPWVIRTWTGHPELADRPLIVAATFQSLGQGLLVWQAVFLAGLSLQRVQVFATGAAALVFVGLAFALGTRFGPLGVALAQPAALLLIAAPVAARALWPRLKG